MGCRHYWLVLRREDAPSVFCCKHCGRTIRALSDGCVLDMGALFVDLTNGQ